MYHKHQTEGLVVKGYDYGDSSKKIVLITDSLGLIYAHIQNCRSLKSKLRSATQDFTLADFVLVKGAGGWKVAGAEARENVFETMRSSPLRLTITANILNIARILLGEETGNRGIFDTLKYFLLNFKNLPDDKIRHAEYATMMKILHQSGLLKQESKLSKCVEKFGFSKDTLSLIKENENLALKIINNGLQAAQVRI